MSVLTLEIDEDLARALEASAQREHKPVAHWAAERLQLAAMESIATAHGYPPGWLKLFGSITDDSFGAPRRTPAHGITPLDID